jgi:hypothetical protein
MAKTVYARTVGGNWSDHATWSTTSGGAADTTDPVATDTAIFDANSGSVTVSSAAACAVVTMTDYPADKTFTMDATLTTTGNVTLPTAAVTFAGTSAWIMTTTCTITPNSKTLSGGLQLKGTSQTYTISGSSLGVVGLLTLSGTTYITITGQSIRVAGGITVTTNTGGTCVLVMTGGTWSGSGWLSCNLWFDGNVAISGTVNCNMSGIVWLSGTFNAGSSTVNSNAGTQYFCTPGCSWYNLAFSSNITLTLYAPLITNHAGGLTFAGTVTINYGGLPPIGTATLSGITKDNGGNILGSCIVYLFKDNGDSTTTFVSAVTSDADTGAYSFTTIAGSTYFVVAFKAGATPVMDVTDRTLVAV